MPNWCNNKTLITFKPEVSENDVKIFKRNLVKDDDSLNLKKLVPLKENSDEYDYDLACEKWGSKWEPDLTKCEIHGTRYKTLELEYDSAWSPILPALDKIYEDNKDIILDITTDYCEHGVGFYGTHSIDEDGVSEEEFETPTIGVELDTLKDAFELKDKIFITNTFDSILNNYPNFNALLRDILDTNDIKDYDAKNPYNTCKKLEQKGDWIDCFENFMYEKYSDECFDIKEEIINEDGLHGLNLEDVLFDSVDTYSDYEME